MIDYIFVENPKFIIMNDDDYVIINTDNNINKLRNKDVILTNGINIIRKSKDKNKIPYKDSNTYLSKNPFRTSNR